MARINSCFIFEDGQYIEVPLSEVVDQGKKKDKYKDRYFYPFGNYLMEVSEEDRRFFYSFTEQIKYLKKLVRGRKVELFSIEAIQDSNTEEAAFLDVFEDSSVDIEEQAFQNYFKERLHKALESLSCEERKIIKLIYEDGLSEREAAKQMNVSKSTMHESKARVLDKLLKMILDS